MTDKIKVWGAVGHDLIWFDTIRETREGAVHRMKEIVRESEDAAIKIGWTVQPYTLVKGHDND